MAEEQQGKDGGAGNGGGGGQTAKPKAQRKPIPYVVFAAEGGPEDEPDGLNFEPAARVEALTQKDAKEAVLKKSERLQDLLRQDMLWLEAVAVRNWDPQHVEYEQPPPVLKGL